MRLALIIDDYLPHSTRVGAKMFHELAVELKERGHEVTVITPHFSTKQALLHDELDGIKIWRFKSGEIKNVGKIKRAINETLLSFNAWMAIRKKVSKETFDGVIYYSPSIFFGHLVKRIKVKCSCLSYLVLRDFFPQWAVDSNIIKSGSLIEKYFRKFEHQSYQQADMIGVMSQKNLEVFKQSNKDSYPVSILRNWAALSPHTACQTKSIRATLNLQNKVIYFYGGNIGHAQDMSNLMRLAKKMQSYPGAHFLFVGQGDEVELICNLAQEWNLTNFTYLPSVNQTEFKDILAEIDVGLFSLSVKHTAHNFPGKLLGYMVQSLPILGSVNSGNDLMSLVNVSSSGLITVNGNDDKLFDNAVSLYKSADLRKALGENAFKLLESEFSVHSIANSILDSLGEHS